MPRLFAPQKDFRMRIPPGWFILSIALAGMMTFVIVGISKPHKEADKAVPSAMAGMKINDSVITASVKSALLADPDVSNLDFKVET